MTGYRQITAAPEGAISHTSESYPRFPTATYVAPSQSRGEVRRSSLARQRTTRDVQVTTSADGEVIPILYGRVSVGGKIENYWDSGSYRYYLIIWGMGECHQVVEAYPDTGVTWTHYLGTTTQASDPDLVSIVTDYSDTLVVDIDGVDVGICYSVARSSISNQLNDFRAVIDGRKVYDPSTATTVFSTNPSLIRADFINDEQIGMGKAVDWDSVEDCADANDLAMSDDSVRRSMGLVLDTKRPCEDWAEVLRLYASCYDYEDNGVVFFVPDRPRASDLTLTEDDFLSMEPRTVPVEDTPNVVMCRWTDTTTEPWGTRTAQAPKTDDVPTPPVYTPTGPARRPVTLQTPGYQSYQVAYREALQRLNRASLCNVEITFELFDEGVALVPGNVVTITHSIGFTSKPFVITEAIEYEIARFRFVAHEYQSNVWSDDVEDDPVYPDVIADDPNDPPDCTGLSLAVVPFQNQDGRWAERITATWDDAEFAFLRYYEVEVRQASTLIYANTASTPEYASPPVQAGNTYRVLVRCLSETRAVSQNWHEASILATGKTIIPGDVPSITGYEFGGQVRLSWMYAVDVGDDILKYEVRYWGSGEDWDDADDRVIDRVDALRLSTEDVPPGDYTFGVKAVDSIFQYSTNATTIAISVTPNTNNLFVGSYDVDYDVSESTNIYEQNNPNGTLQWFTDMDERPSTNTLFTTTPLNNTNYPLAPISYHENSNSEFVSEEVDFGDAYGGTFQALFTAEAVEGSITTYLDLATVSGGPYTSYTALVASTTARYARVRVAATGSGNTLAVHSGGTIRLDIAARHEHGNGTLGAGGTAEVELEQDFSQYKSISITPALNGSTVPGTAYYDNVDLVSDPGTFDVYIEDNAGSDMPSGSEFSYDFWGI